MTVLVILEAAVLIVLSVLVVGLLRAYGTVLKRLHELDGGAAPASPPPFRTISSVPGPREPRELRELREPSELREPQDLELGETNHTRRARAHDIAGVGLSGDIVAIRTVAVDHDTVLVFLSSGCAGCAAFWEDLARRREPTDSRVLVVTKGPEDESRTLLGELAPPTTDVIMSSQAWIDFDIPGSPYVIVVDGHTGRITGEGSGTSLTQVSGLIRQALGDGRSIGKPRHDAERETDVDRALLAAGIGPGHPSLYRSEK